MRTSRGKKIERQPEVVEHGQDRRPVADVEVDEQVHRPDLVAEVEVDGRLVEDEDRGRLGDGEGQQDELPLAERQLARVATEQVPNPDPLDRRGNRRPIGRPRAPERILVRQPAERDDLLDPRRERQASPAGARRRGGGRSRPGRAADRAAVERRPGRLRAGRAR